MRYKLMVLLSFILTLCAYPSDVKFYNISDIYRIPKRAAFSVCKDNNGFIWTSFTTGLIRISESDCRIYQLPYNSANVIHTKVIFDNSLLIAYTNNGQIFIYDEIGDCFNLLVDIRQELDFQYISIGNIIVDSRKNLWISSSLNLFKYENKQLISILKSNSESFYATQYDETQLFFATEEGLNLLDINTLKMETIYRFPSSLPVSCLFYDKQKDKLWIGTSSQGLFYFNVSERLFYKSPIDKLPRQPILSIQESADSTVFVGFDGQGVWELTREGSSVLNNYMEDVNNPSSLSGDGVYDILCDDNKVWIATFGGGLSFFEKESSLVSRIRHKPYSSNSLSNNYINDVIEDSNGNIWLATNNGISKWNVTKDKWEHFFQDKKEQAKVFLTVFEDSNNNIWSGTYSSGLYILDGKTGRELNFNPQVNPGSKMPGRYIYDFFKDSDGDIWIGGIQNLACYYTKENRIRSYSDQPVRTFREISPGKILLACTYGLILLDKKTEQLEHLLNGYLVQDICIVGNDIWTATSGDGLIRYNYNNKTSEKFSSESGLSSNNVSSLIYADGFLWIGTDNGLCRLKTSDNTIVSYSSIYSLSNIAFNVNSSIKLKNGNLIWGTNDGAIIFNPNSLYQSNTVLEGHIFFQDISVSGRSIRENKNIVLNSPVNNLTTISLKYDENTFSLELIPMGASSGETKFSWIMEGIDNEWSKPSNSSLITYSNLPSGDFSLKIRMYDSSLSQIINERSLTLNIMPPFWHTWWFRLLIAVFITGILYYSLNLYIHRLKRMHADDKIRFFVNMAHDIRTSLTLIKAPIEGMNKDNNLSEETRYYLNIASEQSKRLSFVTTQLLDFQKVDIGKGQLFLVMSDIVLLIHKRILMFEESTKEKNIKLVFVSNLKTFYTAVDEIKMEKVVDNLISNAIKYSFSNSKVEIKLDCKEKEWILEVKDYGCGISDKEKKKLFKEFYRGYNPINSKVIGSGIGLLLVKNYVTMHDGDIQLESKENEGSSFKILIPYKVINETTSLEVIPVIPAEIEPSLDQQLVPDEKNKNKKKKHVLIVEDNSELQNFLTYSFRSQYEISTANDGVEGWEIAQKTMPDLVISDIMMPNMDGFELCKLIKSTFDTSHIPIILLTALSDKTKQLEGLGLGADDYITKPFDMTILLQRIKTIVSNRDIVREKALKLIKYSNDEQSILNNELNDQFVKKALKIVRENIANSEFGKDEFASAMSVSSSLLYKKIKALTNQSPTDFIKTIRLDYSLELLQSRKYTVTEVSELCGFFSVGYFSTVFKKHFKKSPSEITKSQLAFNPSSSQ